MGKASRQRPERLAEKLLMIRLSLGLSQNQMLHRLGMEEGYRSYISEFETGKREPPLLVLLAYAQAANSFVDVLIDDSLDLADKLPSRKKSEGVARAALGKRRR